MNILLIENDPSDRVLIKTRFRQGLSKRTPIMFADASTLKQAYDLLEVFNPDVILMDLDLEGTPYVYVIPYINTFAKYAPVVILSGMVDELDIQQALKNSPAKTYLDKKTINSTTLVPTILKVLSKEL